MFGPYTGQSGLRRKGIVNPLSGYDQDTGGFDCQPIAMVTLGKQRGFRQQDSGSGALQYEMRSMWQGPDQSQLSACYDEQRQNGITLPEQVVS